MTPVLHIGPVFGCRVMMTKGKNIVRRNVQVPATTLAQARERLTSMFAEVWPDWEITYLLQPHQIGGGQ